MEKLWLTVSKNLVSRKVLLICIVLCNLACLAISSSANEVHETTDSVNSTAPNNTTESEKSSRSLLRPLRRVFRRHPLFNGVRNGTAITPNNREKESEESEEESAPDRIHHIKALINHTLTHGGEEDLDQLIFSSLPHGSKLVVQSVKVIPTDEHGDGKASPVHWNVSLKNATESGYPEDEVGDSDDDSDEGEDYDEPEGPVGAAREGGIELTEHDTHKNSTNSTNGVPEKSMNDLAIAGSHAQENYKSYGSSHRDKEHGKKHYHGTDHGKTHKVTDTDTDGKKKTNYHGKEDGITDYAKANGKKQSNEGERFRDTKKKNKGRRVSGFKRVYHKEEFQRTEHFYDDEDAKRIAESFGQKDAKEHSSHGKKDDDRKYHGTRNEYTDGKKIKNEHGTSNGHNKGQLTEYKDTEKHNHGTHYNKAFDSPRTHNPDNQNYHHPNHNYRASYSNINKNTIRRPNSLNSATRNYIPPVPATAASNTGNHQMIESPKGIIAVVSKAPMTASFTVTEYLPQSSDSSLHSSADDLRPSKSHYASRPNHNNARSHIRSKHKPDEIKMFYSPRDHQLPGTSEIGNFDNNNHHNHYPNNNQYHHNPFLLARHQMHHNLRQRNAMGYGRTPFLNKIGNASVEDEDLFRKNYTTYYRNSNGTYDSERYARNYPTNVPITNVQDATKMHGYSTIVKHIPGVYINLTDGDSSSSTDSRQQSSNYPKLASPSGKYSEKLPMKVNEITFTTPIPAIYRRPPGGRWFSISFGDPNVFDDIPRPNGFSPAQRGRPGRPISVASVPQGHVVRPSRARPRQPYLHRPPVHFIRSPSIRFDHSKYPPNVVHSIHPAVQPFLVDASASVLNETEIRPANSSSTTRHEDSSKEGNYKITNNQAQDLNPSISNPGSTYKSGPFQQFHRPKLNTAPFSNGSPPNQSRPRTPHSLPPFMNNLMDTVANFFSNVG